MFYAEKNKICILCIYTYIKTHVYKFQKEVVSLKSRHFISLKYIWQIVQWQFLCCQREKTAEGFKVFKPLLCNNTL